MDPITVSLCLMIGIIAAGCVMVKEKATKPHTSDRYWRKPESEAKKRSERLGRKNLDES